MKTIEQKIKSVIDGMGVLYLFENWATANVELDRSAFPVVLNVLPVSGKFSVGKTQLKDCPNCMFAFLDEIDLDVSGVENDAVIERMKILAKEFIKEMNKSGLFEYLEGDFPYSVVYDKLDVNVTGIVVEMQVKECSGFSLC